MWLGCACSFWATWFSCSGKGGKHRCLRAIGSEFALAITGLWALSDMTCAAVVNLWQSADTFGVGTHPLLFCDIELQPMGDVSRQGLGQMGSGCLSDRLRPRFGYNSPALNVSGNHPRPGRQMVAPLQANSNRPRAIFFLFTSKTPRAQGAFQELPPDLRPAVIRRCTQPVVGMQKGIIEGQIEVGLVAVHGALIEREGPGFHGVGEMSGDRISRSDRKKQGNAAHSLVLAGGFERGIWRSFVCML